MITLKEIKRYPDTNSVEATWVDRTTTPILFADVDEEGNPTGTTHTEMQVVEVLVKCHSYDQVQMDMLAADLGADLAEYQWIIDEVQANFIARPDTNFTAARMYQIKAELAAIDQRRIRPLAEGDTEYLATLNAQATTLRTELQGLL